MKPLENGFVSDSLVTIPASAMFSRCMCTKVNCGRVQNSRESCSLVGTVTPKLHCWEVTGPGRSAPKRKQHGQNPVVGEGHSLQLSLETGVKKTESTNPQSSLQEICN